MIYTHLGSHSGVLQVQHFIEQALVATVLPLPVQQGCRLCFQLLSREQSAESREQKAESREQRAESMGKKKQRQKERRLTQLFKHYPLPVCTYAGPPLRTYNGIEEDTGHRTYIYRAQDTGQRIQDKGHRTRDTGHRIQDKGHGI
jgi:hypothetical protein